jgi:NTP pyrophosphatase (non-canonical NTP hydrolase)
MNAKIQQLMDRSFTDEQGERFDPERFAELIVQECAEVAKRTMLSGSGVDPDTFTGTVTTVQAIKKHFGIAE